MINSKLAYRLIPLSLVFGFAAQAAPVDQRVHLPIDKKTVERLQDDYDFSTEEVGNFIKVLNDMTFFADHENPESIEGLKDRSKNKIFYAAPFLSPNEARETVGGEEFATWAITVIDEADEVAKSFNYDLTLFFELTKEKDDAKKQIKDVNKSLADQGLKESDRANLSGLKVALEQQVESLDKKLKKIVNAGADEFSTLDNLQTQIVDRLTYQFSRLGIAPTGETTTLLDSSESRKVMRGIAQLRASAAQGQFGLRQVVLESGLDEAHKEVFAKYRLLRPDVTVKSLGVKKLFVKASAQISKDSVKPSVAMIRDVNRSSQSDKGRGECGGSRSCSVVVEYTEIGARSGALAKQGAVVLPVTFTGDARVSVPNFDGRFDCNFTNGWWAKGRADVKDGAIIYDGDVYNKIKYGSSNIQQYCDINITEGGMDSAAWHILHDLEKFYQKMYNERVQRSELNKAAYETYVRSELDRHANQSQSDKTDYMGSVLGWARGLIGGWQTLAVGLVSEARNFYWHTRIEDTSSIDTVKIKKRVNYDNVTNVVEYGFDGFPVTCRKKIAGSLESSIVACSSQMAANPNTELGAEEEVCDSDDSFEECSEELAESTETNDDGFEDIF